MWHYEKRTQCNRIIYQISLNEKLWVWNNCAWSRFWHALFKLDYKVLCFQKTFENSHFRVYNLSMGCINFEGVTENILFFCKTLKFQLKSKNFTNLNWFFLFFLSKSVQIIEIPKFNLLNIVKFHIRLFQLSLTTFGWNCYQISTVDVYLKYKGKAKNLVKYIYPTPVRNTGYYYFVF